MAQLELAKFHDKDGEPLYLSGRVGAIFTRRPQSKTISAFPGVVPTGVTEEPLRVIVMPSGEWEVVESCEEILAAMVNEKEEAND